MAISGERKVAVVGGAGFVGSHFVDALLARPEVEHVTVIDNFSSGREAHLARARTDARLSIARIDATDRLDLSSALRHHDVVAHFASNPDIARAAEDPDLDFRCGTELTRALCEGARIAGVRRILYASGSGVYGDRAGEVLREDDGPFAPISTYGASKLAGEALVCAYAHLFGMRSTSFRFANLVGERQTHGVCFDFARKLARDRTALRVLGDGEQRKPYLDVADAVAAMFIVWEAQTSEYAVFNVGPTEAITVREIADVALEVFGLTQTAIEYAGGRGGWRGDVPDVMLDTAAIRRLGWRSRWTSREAVARALRALRAAEGSAP